MVVYNVFVKALSRNLRWREAEDMVRRMTDKGISPDWETYSYLVPCLIRAQQPALAVEKLDEMRAANIRLVVEENAATTSVYFLLLLVTPARV